MKERIAAGLRNKPLDFAQDGSPFDKLRANGERSRIHSRGDEPVESPVEPKVCGFTLIELTLVATIILVLVLLSSPRFKGTFGDIQTEDAAKRMVQIIRYGQQRAIVEEVPYRLRMDFEAGSYWLTYRSAEETDGDLEEGAGAKEIYKRVTGRLGEKFTLPEGVKFAADTDEINFYPDGRSDKVAVNIENTDGRMIVLRTTGRAGYVEVWESDEDEGVE